MPGIRASARLQQVNASCGHTVSAMIPPGELGRIGRKHIAEAENNPCGHCLGQSLAKGLLTASQEWKDCLLLWMAAERPYLLQKMMDESAKTYNAD